VLQVVPDPQSLRVVHGEAVEFGGVDEAELGGLVTDPQLAADDTGDVADVETGDGPPRRYRQ
jgi:hypothetical protein